MSEMVRATSILLGEGASEVRLNAYEGMNIWKKANDWYEERDQHMTFLIRFDNGSVARGDTSDYPGGTFAESVSEYLNDSRSELNDEDPLAVAIDEDQIDFGGQLWREVSADAALAN